MRTDPDIYRENDAAREADGVQMADWKESPRDVLDCVDGQLAAYGLEIVMIACGDDAYHWRIASLAESRRQAAAPAGEDKP